jgi:hypothetical protein
MNIHNAKEHLCFLLGNLFFFFVLGWNRLSQLVLGAFLYVLCCNNNKKKKKKKKRTVTNQRFIIFYLPYKSCEIN